MTQISDPRFKSFSRVFLDLSGVVGSHPHINPPIFVSIAVFIYANIP